MIQKPQMHEHPNLNRFEETIIEVFDLPKNVKELVPATSPIPNINLEIGPALPPEEFSLLDYFEDNVCRTLFNFFFPIKINIFT